jgi:preprotein translocase subunit SecE
VERPGIGDSVTEKQWPFAMGAGGIFAKRLFMNEEITPSRGVMGWPAQIKDYFGELQLEMKRVTWPAWKQVRATTGVVIFAVFAFAAYFAVVDSLVGRGIQKLFDTFTK